MILMLGLKYSQHIKAWQTRCQTFQTSHNSRLHCKALCLKLLERFVRRFREIQFWPRRIRRHFQNEGECEVRAWNESCAAAARHENFCIIHASPRESERHWPMLGVGQFTSQRLCQTSHIAPKSKQMTSSIHLAKQPSTGDSKLHVEHQCYASHAKTIFTSTQNLEPSVAKAPWKHPIAAQTATLCIFGTRARSKHICLGES